MRQKKYHRLQFGKNRRFFPRPEARSQPITYTKEETTVWKKAIIGKKVGMTQIFDADGKVVPVTVIEAGPCTVVQKKDCREGRLRGRSDGLPAHHRKST